MAGKRAKRTAEERSGRRGLRPDDLYRFRIVSDPQLSPEGGRIAYVVTSFDAERDELQTSIWLAPADRAGAARAFSSGTSDSSPRWSPDGRSLLFVGDRGKGKQLLLASLEGGEPRALTDERDAVSSPAWSPDGASVAYVTRVGDPPPGPDDPPSARNAPRVIRHLSYRFDGAGLRDPRRSHLFTVDVLTGRRTQLTDGDWDDDQPAWSPDGRRIAFTSDRRPERDDEVLRGDIWTVRSTGGRARRLTRARGGAQLPAFSPDGRWLAYVGDEAGAEHWSQPSRVLVVPADGKAPPRQVTDGPPLLGPLPGRLLDWMPDGDLLVVQPDRGALTLRRVSVETGTRADVVAGDRRVRSFSLSSDASRLAFVADWVDAPMEVWSSSPAGAADALEVSGANAALRAAVRLAPAERRTSTAPDGTGTESFLTRGGARRSGPGPLVLDIHGGPHGWHPSGSPASWLLTQVLAAAGFSVLQPNPRGSAGYGDAFVRACVGDWGGGDFDDLMAALERCVEDGIADDRALYCWGYSYGGFMTTLVASRTDRFRAVVVGAPVVDQLSMLGTTDIPLFTIHELDGTQWERPDAYRKLSPLTYAADIRTPVLLLHHDGDLRCPIGQSEQLFTTLKLLDGEVELVRYPGGSHGTFTPSQLVDRMERILAWFQSHPGADAGGRKGSR